MNKSAIISVKVSKTKPELPEGFHQDVMSYINSVAESTTDIGSRGMFLNEMANILSPQEEHNNEA